MELREILKLLIEHELLHYKKQREIERTGIVLDDVFPSLTPVIQTILGASGDDGKGDAIDWYIVDVGGGKTPDYTMDELLDLLLGPNFESPKMIIKRGW